MYSLKVVHQYYDRLRAITFSFKTIATNAQNFIDPIIRHDKIFDIFSSCSNLNKKVQTFVEQLQDEGKFYVEGSIDVYNSTDENILQGSYVGYVFSSTMLLFTLDDKKKKKSLRHEATIAIDETSISSAILNTNAEFVLNFITGPVITFRDVGLTGDFWVNSIKNAMLDRIGRSNLLEKRHSSKKLIKQTKKKN